MKYIVIITCFLSMVFNLGCISSNKIEVSTSKPFEKRYTKNDTIIINNKKIEITNKESVWILTGTTLNNLLQYAGGKDLMEIE